MTDSKLPSPDPARYESPPLGYGDQQQLQQAQQRNNKILWGIFALLLVLTAGVVFVLPSMVQPVAPPAVVVAAPAATAPTAAEPAPFAEAQRLRSRQEAQDVLAPLLELQETLEKQQVQQWAAEAYAAALATAQQGDTAYSNLEYEQALASYRQALAAMQQISASTAEVFAARMAAGDAALAAGDATGADAAYSVAILLDPNSSEAVQGMERARVLNQVLALMEAGRELQADGKFDEAREKFGEASALDPAHEGARTALAEVATAQANQNFAAVMSRGFSALQAGDPVAARAAFEQAGNLRPGSTEVAAALQQAKDQETLTATTVQINAAQAAEATEDWATALAAWNATLAIDPNLVAAQEGQRRTQSRTNLDDFLTSTIANPYRLGDQAVYAQTEQVVADAERLLTPTPKLQQQLQQVKDFMARVKVAVPVTIQSDGQTAVTVYGIGELGQLTSHTLNLTPGSYVAVGVRAGYRDVRQEFVVGLDGQSVQITVACSDTI